MTIRSQLVSVATFTISSCGRSEEHTSELQSLRHLVCRLLLEKKNVDTDETNQYYRYFARAMHRIDYDGCISYERYHQLPGVNGHIVHIEFGHKNAPLVGQFDT